MLEHVLDFFISAAHADTAAPTQAGAQGGMSFVMMFVVFFLFIYFAIWRPQNKRAKEQRTMLDSLAKGDEILTVAGMLGRITKLTDQYMVVAIANNLEVTMQKSSVANVLPKGTIKSLEL